MVARHYNDVARRGHQRTTTLVDVLCKLANYWMRCECGAGIGIAGLDGWKKRGLELGERIDLLNTQMPVVKSPSKKSAMQAELATLKAESEALETDWAQASEEADAHSDLFGKARQFCTRACGLGDTELFNAALVGFDPDRLPPQFGPSKHRMTEITTLLKNLHPDTWNSQPWANPTRPTMRAAKRVGPNQLLSFIDQNLRSTAKTAEHVGTESGPAAQDDPLLGLNAKVKTTSVNSSTDTRPYLGLLFNDDFTVSRLGNDYQDKRTCVIALSRQQFQILKFIHEAGENGRTKSEMEAAGFTSLRQEKWKINDKLIPIDLRFKKREHKLIHIKNE